MISNTKEVQELIKQLSSTLETVMRDNPDKDFPYSVEVQRLRKLSEASILLGKLFSELGERIAYDRDTKHEELEHVGEFDWQDYTLWLHPIDARNLTKLAKEVLKHISTDKE